MLQKLLIFSQLAKSGIVTLVLISVTGGYLIGHNLEHSLDIGSLLITLLGVFFLASGASALNQYQERDIDARMKRTSSRPIPTGKISPRAALASALTLISCGLVLLAVHTEKALIGMGLLAIFFYNGLYTLWWKKRWPYAAIPGAIPGALPILMGYTSSHLTPIGRGGWYLFFLVFYWQMPHFWSLALKFAGDYKAGGIPTLPVSRGFQVTMLQIILWTLGYVGVVMIAPLFVSVGWLYLSLATAVSIKIIVELFKFTRGPLESGWLRFFLWINASLVIFVTIAAVDAWSYRLFLPWIRQPVFF